MKKSKKIGSCLLILLVITLVSCTRRKSEVDDAPYLQNDKNESNCMDLSAADSYEINEEVSGGSISVFEKAIFTNSEKITVKNNSDSCVEVYLYNKDNPDQVIQQFTLGGKGSKEFTNLTSRYLYQIGVEVQADCQVCLTVSK